MALDLAETIDLACRHDAGNCVLTSTRPLLGVSKRSVSLEAVRSVKLESYRPRQKDSLHYGVVLVTRDGEIKLSDTRSLDRASRASVKNKLDQFLRDPDAQPLELRYDSGERWSLFALPLLGVALVAAIWGLLRRTRVVFRWDEKQIFVERTRWPLSAWSRSLRLEDVKRAHLIEKEHSGGLFNVALELRSGEDLHLLAKPSYFKKHHQVTVDALQALLARWQLRTDSPHAHDA